MKGSNSALPHCSEAILGLKHTFLNIITRTIKAQKIKQDEVEAFLGLNQSETEALLERNPTVFSLEQLLGFAWDLDIAIDFSFQSGEPPKTGRPPSVSFLDLLGLFADVEMKVFHQNMGILAACKELLAESDGTYMQKSPTKPLQPKTLEIRYRRFIKDPRNQAFVEHFRKASLRDINDVNNFLFTEETLAYCLDLLQKHEMNQ